MAVSPASALCTLASSKCHITHLSTLCYTRCGDDFWGLSAVQRAHSLCCEAVRDSERLQLALIILVWLDDCQIRHMHTEWYITVYHASFSADTPN